MPALSVLAALATLPNWTGIEPLDLPARRPTFSWTQPIGPSGLVALPGGFLEVQWDRIIMREPATGRVRWTRVVGSVEGRQHNYSPDQLDDTVLLQWTTYRQGEKLAYTHLAGFAVLTGKRKFDTVLPSTAVSLPIHADHKLVFSMFDGLGVVDPQTGRVLDHWKSGDQKGSFAALCPSMRGHPFSFGGSVYHGTRPLGFGSAPWGPPSAVYVWGDRFLAFYDYEDYAMELGPVSGHQGIARLSLSADGKAVDEWNGRLTYLLANEQGFSVTERVANVVEVDRNGFWGVKFIGDRCLLERVGADGRAVAGYPRPQIDGMVIYTNRGILFDRDGALWVLNGRDSRKIGPALGDNERITRFGVLSSSNLNASTSLRPLPAGLYLK